MPAGLIHLYSWSVLHIIIIIIIIIITWKHGRLIKGEDA